MQLPPCVELERNRWFPGVKPETTIGLVETVSTPLNTLSTKQRRTGAAHKHQSALIRSCALWRITLVDLPREKCVSAFQNHQKRQRK